MKKQFVEEKIQKERNLFNKKIIEKGDIEWSPESAEIRKKILEEVGAEYKQINLIAEVLYEIVKSNTDLQNNEVIQNALAEFEKINRIRNREL